MIERTVEIWCDACGVKIADAKNQSAAGALRPWSIQGWLRRNGRLKFVRKKFIRQFVINIAAIHAETDAFCPACALQILTELKRTITESMLYAGSLLKKRNK